MTMTHPLRSALWALPPLLGGIGLMLFGPPRVLGLSAWLMGGLLVVVGGWVTLRMLARDATDEMAHGEAQAWLGLLFANLIYFAFLMQLRQLGSLTSLLHEPVSYLTASILGVLGATWLLLAWWLRARYPDVVVEDERDRGIARKSSAFGDGALMFCVGMLALVLAMTPDVEGAWVTPSRAALMLFNLLLLRVVLRWNAAVFLYWWDRR
jgi:hypothetical protein